MFPRIAYELQNEIILIHYGFNAFGGLKGVLVGRNQIINQLFDSTFEV